MPLFDLPPFPVGTLPVHEHFSDANLEEDKPHHGPPRSACQPLDELKVDNKVKDIDVDEMDPKTAAEAAEASAVKGTNGDTFLALMNAACEQQVKLVQAKKAHTRKQHYPGNSARTKQHHVQVWRELAAGGRQSFITGWLNVKASREVSIS